MPSLDTADVRSIVSFYQDNATKADPSPSEEVLLIRMCEDLEKFTKDEWHPSKFAKRGTKCGCLSYAFCHSGIHMGFANYAMRHFKLEKLIQDQFFVEMHRSSMLRGMSRITPVSSLSHGTTSRRTQILLLLILPQKSARFSKEAASAQVGCFFFFRGPRITGLASSMMRWIMGLHGLMETLAKRKEL